MPGSADDCQIDPKEAGEDPPTVSSLLDWVSLVLQRSEQAPAAHHTLLLDQLDRVVRGDVDRLMILMPPGSAKSIYTSILFPAWWFTRHPASSVIATSHTTSLAEHFGRQVRDLVREFGNRLGYTLHGARQAAGRWQITCNGDYFATGIRGPLTGRRADLVIIDDPVKSQADADSPVLRERLWNWYRFDLTTRLKPRGRVILIMTRWHEDDLAGRLLAQNKAEWHLISLPALAEDSDPLHRVVGAALWPEWENERALLRKRDTVGERAWSALYQQSPRPITGSLFKTDCIDILDVAPPRADGLVVRAWDLAATAATGGNDPDWTTGVKLTRDERGRFIVLDVVHMRGTPHDVEAAIEEAARVDGRGVTISLPEDPGQAGKHQASYLAGRLAGHRVTTSRETGAKTTRAAPVASQVEARNFAMLRGDWNHAFLEELRDFPFGRKDDQVDALSRAFTVLTEARKPTRRVSLSLLAR